MLALTGPSISVARIRPSTARCRCGTRTAARRLRGTRAIGEDSQAADWDHSKAQATILLLQCRTRLRSAARTSQAPADRLPAAPTPDQERSALPRGPTGT